MIDTTVKPTSSAASSLAAKAFALGCVFLSGCVLFESRPVEYVPYEVKVPIPVPCAAEVPAEPDWATRGLRKADDLDTKVKGLLAEREQRMGYEEKLKAATDGCR